MHPIVLLDAPGESFWSGFLDFARTSLVERGYVGPHDLNLFTLTDSAEEAAEEIARFYANYDSMRFVGQRLVLRLRAVPDEDRLAELAETFSDIIVSGGIQRCDPFPPEIADEDALDRERVVLHFDNASYGRLRELIDALNASSPPGGPSRDPQDRPAGPEAPDAAASS